MEWIETNGVVLRYELSGTGRMPLLLIHELGGSLEFWDAVLPAFQPAFRTATTFLCTGREMPGGEGVLRATLSSSSRKSPTSIFTGTATILSMSCC